MKYKIKLFEPTQGKAEERSVLQVLRSKFWASGQGMGKVKEFENSFNKYIHSDRCVAVNSGTAALHLALSLVDIKGKEVILPPITFVSSAHAIVYNGGIPVFADVDPKTLCIDPTSIKKKITTRTKVLLPVHLGGMPCNLDEITSICKQHKLKLIEDAAHACGSIYKRKKIGNHGMAVCFSFHPVKNLAMPTGGAISLNGVKSSLHQKVLSSRRWCGISNRDGPFYDVARLGWNYYMNEFSAAIGLAQLKKLDKSNKKRKDIAKTYSKKINLEDKMPFDPQCSYHLYWIRVKNRKDFIKKMAKKGIETGIHFLPINKMKFYMRISNSINSDLINSNKLSAQIVSIPMHPNLTDNEISFIINSINKLC